MGVIIFCYSFFFFLSSQINYLSLRVHESCLGSAQYVCLSYKKLLGFFFFSLNHVKKKKKECVDPVQRRSRRRRLFLSLTRTASKVCRVKYSVHHFQLTESCKSRAHTHTYTDVDLYAYDSFNYCFLLLLFYCSSMVLYILESVFYFRL